MHMLHTMHIIPEPLVTLNRVYIGILINVMYISGYRRMVCGVYTVGHATRCVCGVLCVHIGAQSTTGVWRGGPRSVVCGVYTGSTLTWVVQ